MTITIQLVDYAAYRGVLHQIRHAVFVQEQGVPAAIEIDRWDPLCIHVLAQCENQCQNQPVGTGRLLPDGHIGRVAVLQSMRQKGIGTQIMQQLLQAAADQGHSQVEISAQHHAIDFYDRLGFQAQGVIYQEAGIDHIKMVKFLQPAHKQQPMLNRSDALAIGAAKP